MFYCLLISGVSLPIFESYQEGSDSKSDIDVDLLLAW